MVTTRSTSLTAVTSSLLLFVIDKPEDRFRVSQWLRNCSIEIGLGSNTDSDGRTEAWRMDERMPEWRIFRVSRSQVAYQ